MPDKLKSMIVQAVSEILDDLKLASNDIVIEIDAPKDTQFGDFSTNIAMKLARILKKSPIEIAELIQDLMLKKFKKMSIDGKIKKVEVKRPGFINIFLSSGALHDILRVISKDAEAFARNTQGDGKKVLIEFVSANPTGPLSIAHARQAAVGDCLGNILNICGYEVSREYYINDEGNQIKNLGLSLQARYLEILGKTVNFPEDGYKGKYLYDLAQKLIKAQGQKYLNNDGSKAVEFFSNYAAGEILGQIKEELELFGVTFDSWYSQKNQITPQRISEAIKELTSKGYIYEKDGATWFKSTQFKDDKDRVIIKSDGLMTYLTPDIAYHRVKFERGFDKLINIWGPDHHGYINRLKASVCALGHCPEDLSILIIQLATLSRGGTPVVMSTRAGEYITLAELMQEVGKDAARFFFLMRRCDSQLEFDLELAKKHSMENPVYYVQYAHARISGIRKLFSELADEGALGDIKEPLEAGRLCAISEEDASILIKKLNCFPDVLINCCESLDPQSLSTYLRELAGDFHAFYNKHRIYTEGKENIEQSLSRYFLIDSVGKVIALGLKIMGVVAPSEM
ncbi:MAG: arginine--tRNA ligase [Candidatus Omnitrophica bacterium]|nr:arginine--tRNA ligase [Candidatus Omnitrophota bacterium]